MISSISFTETLGNTPELNLYFDKEVIKIDVNGCESANLDKHDIATLITLLKEFLNGVSNDI